MADHHGISSRASCLLIREDKHYIHIHSSPGTPGRILYIFRETDSSVRAERLIKYLILPANAADGDERYLTGLGSEKMLNVSYIEQALCYFFAERVEFIVEVKELVVSDSALW